MFKKSLTYIIPLIVLCCIYAGSGQAGKVQPENVPLTPEDKEMVKAINGFFPCGAM